MFVVYLLSRLIKGVGFMEGVLQSVVSNIKEKQQLHGLLKKANTLVIFTTEEEKGHLYLSFSDTHSDYTERSDYCINILGSKEIVNQVLMGQVALRDLQKHNKVTVQGNYRQVLLVEALLLLCRKAE